MTIPPTVPSTVHSAVHPDDLMASEYADARRVPSAVDEHFAHCVACRDRLDGLRTIRAEAALLRLRPCEAPDIWPVLASRIVERSASESPRSRARPRAYLLGLVVAFLLGASSAVGFGALARSFAAASARLAPPVPDLRALRKLDALMPQGPRP